MDLVKQLSEAVNIIEMAVGSGRLGFDYAVREYVESHDNQVARAFALYVTRLV